MLGMEDSSTSNEPDSLPPPLVSRPGMIPVDDMPPTSGAIDETFRIDDDTQLVIPPRSDRPHADRPHPDRPHPIWSKLMWIVVMVLTVIVFRWVTPRAIEEIQYALVRGSERAKYDAVEVANATQPLTDLSKTYATVANVVGPSVVHINTSTSSAGSNAPIIDQFGPQPHGERGQGSGVIIDSQGYILTNYHVVRDSTAIDVAISGRRPMRAEVVGVDPPTDLAVLKVDANDLIAAQWADSDEIEVGSLVWAVGSPFGLERSVTSGILSAKHRAGKAGTVYQDFLQTDAAVNPGNSGGPLVDARGRVIGINTAIVGQTYQGISFAIPSNVAKDVYDRMLTGGRVQRGWLGVQLGEVTPDRASKLGLPVGQGAYIERVVADPTYGSPAYDAGVQVGDVIVSWNGNKISSPMSLSRTVAKTPVGSQAQVTAIRNGKQIGLQVTVGERAAGL